MQYNREGISLVFIICIHILNSPIHTNIIITKQGINSIGRKY